MPRGLTTASSTTAAYLSVQTLPQPSVRLLPHTPSLFPRANRFIGLNIPEEHGDWAVFTSPRVEIVGQTDTEGNYSASSWRPMNNAACDGAGITDYRFHGHETGVQTIEFSAEGPRTLWLMFMLVGSGHMHHHGDGGMHMHHEDGGMHHGDGGMHMHHEDGGMHMHHEDGGMHHEDGGMHHEDGGMHSDGGA